MDYTGKRVKVVNFDGWREDFREDYSRTNTYIGQTGKIEVVRDFDHKFRIKYDDGELQQIDIENGRLYFKLDNLEILEDAYLKPPLGVMPKQIFEWYRVIDLCRALHEYSLCEDVDKHLMIKWSDELNDRLYGLKGDCEQININDVPWFNGK